MIYQASNDKQNNVILEIGNISFKEVFLKKCSVCLRQEDVKLSHVSHGEWRETGQNSLAL